jgi:hypothetical protein
LLRLELILSLSRYHESPTILGKQIPPDIIRIKKSISYRSG